MSGTSWVDRFDQALAAFDRAGVEELTRNYVSYLYSAGDAPGLLDEVPDVLDELRRHLRYEQLEKVADAALVRFPEHATVRRYYAQALVDSGQPGLAAELYERLVDDSRAPDEDRVDARGGLGRCLKQLFLATRDQGRRAEYLRRAFAAYHEVHDTDPARTYHGINAVALGMRAEREGIPLPSGSPSPPDLAAQILAHLARNPNPDRWSGATAAEACVALGRLDTVDRTVRWLRREDDAFMIASFLRQLVEVWQLDTASAPGDRLLPVVRSALLRCRGGEVTVGMVDMRAARPGGGGDLEKVFDRTRFKNLPWYVTGLRRCRAIARVEDRHQEGVGTGFLVNGKDLHERLPEGPLLMTNAHVVPERLDVADARVGFRGLGGDPAGPLVVKATGIVWSSPSTGGVDATLLRLAEYPRAAAPIPIARRLPAVSPESAARAYVIGHPHGLANPQFSLQDNLLLDHDEHVLHYRSPTEHGSSGSPVMNDDWDLIGLHHAGGDRPRLNRRGGIYAANEGVTMAAIRAGLDAEPVIP